MTTTAHIEEPHEHEHPKFLAHHFDTPQQQFDSGKLGTWLFLTTEILLFSGLFCAYSVYRANHPEIFEFAHKYLDKNMGALNTIILIFSSFTMAWGVRAAQLGQRKLCVGLLAITVVCGAGFLVVKGMEYYAKWQHVVLPGTWYNPPHLPGEEHGEATAGKAETKPAAAAPAPAVLEAATPVGVAADGHSFERSTVAISNLGPAGLNPTWYRQEDASITHQKFPAPPEVEMTEPANAHIFFGIYFLMTGLHGLHVIAGMCLITWVMIRAHRGDFGPEYYSPVDFVGLYWHIVDIVWIFLFPLLYLIT